MPGKHTTAFPLRRYGFIAGAATLLVVLVSWVAVRAVGPAQPARVPLMVQPTVPLVGVTPSPTPPATPSAAASPTLTRTSPSPSASPSATPSTTTAKPSRRPTRTATPRKTTAPAPPASFAANYRLGGTWDRGFTAGVTVTNKSGPARNWTVRISYAEEAGVRIRNVWNATLSRDGDTFVLTGGPLAPGASVMLGFEASKQVRSQIRVAGCTVDGTPCEGS